MRKIIKWFFNWFYKIRPPESVKYYKTQNAARARLMNAPDGSLQMEIKGEKYPFAGFPRGHILTNSLAKLKSSIKNKIFNEAFAHIEEIYQENKNDSLPVEKMAPAVRHIWESFEKMGQMEVSDYTRGRIKLVKKVLCYFIQEDDAYRFRTMMFLDLIEQKKIRLSKQDLYFARAKYWKADRYKKILGKWFDAY